MGKPIPLNYWAVRVENDLMTYAIRVDPHQTLHQCLACLLIVFVYCIIYCDSYGLCGCADWSGSTLVTYVKLFLFFLYGVAHISTKQGSLCSRILLFPPTKCTVYALNTIILTNYHNLKNDVAASDPGPKCLLRSVGPNIHDKYRKFNILSWLCMQSATVSILKKKKRPSIPSCFDASIEASRYR